MLIKPDEIKAAADQRSLAKRVPRYATDPMPEASAKMPSARVRSVSLFEKYKPQMDDLRNRLKAKRERADLSFRQLSKITGISHSTLYRFEMGGSQIRAEMLLAIQEWLKSN